MIGNKLRQLLTETALVEVYLGLYLAIVIDVKILTQGRSAVAGSMPS